MNIQIENQVIKAKKHVLFEDLNLTLNGNKIILTGINGCGKSSLLNYIYNNVNLDMTYIMQDPILFDGFSISDNIDIICKGRQDIEKISSYLDKFMIKDYSKKVKKLSGGQKQMLAVSIGLGSNSEVLLVDEPENNLDEKNKLILMQILNDEDRDILLVSHEKYPNFVEVCIDEQV